MIVTDEMVKIVAVEISARNPPDCCGEPSAGWIKGACKCQDAARAALEAVAPMIRAAALEGAATNDNERLTAFKKGLAVVFYRDHDAEISGEAAEYVDRAVKELCGLAKTTALEDAHKTAEKYVLRAPPASAREAEVDAEVRHVVRLILRDIRDLAERAHAPKASPPAKPSPDGS